LAALRSSSLRHSAMDLMFLKAASLAPVHSSYMALNTFSDLTKTKPSCVDWRLLRAWRMAMIFSL